MRMERAPYTVHILEAAALPEVNAITAMMGSQMSKTESSFSMIGHKLDDDPQPVMYVGPTKQNLTEVAEPRILSMIQSSDSLSSKYLGGKKSTKTCKRINGVTLRLAHAGSPTELASNPAAMAIIDELDRMKDIPGEGSVIGLVDARLSNYADSMRSIWSTPTVGSANRVKHPETGISYWEVADPTQLASPVWLEWQSGSREEWAVPCPECKDYFVPHFALLTWDKPEGEKVTPEQAMETAKLTCECCGSLIEQHHQRWMNENGRFVAPGQWVEEGTVKGDLEVTTHRSFWVSGLMSPWRTWGQRAYDWISAVRRKSQGQIQTTINTKFGELYAAKGEAPELESVQKCAQDYTSGSVPKDAQLVFCSVDVQKDRLVYVVRAWGYEFESWLIEAGELWGETDLPNVWRKLDNLVDREFGAHTVTACAVDAGYRPDHVYDWCNNRSSIGYAIKGLDRATKPYSMTRLETNKAGRVHRRGQKLWRLDSGHYKSWVHERINRKRNADGGWHLPSDIDEDYCRQIIAETRIVSAAGTEKWIKVANDNHFLDCEYMQAFLARLMRVADLQPIEEAEEEFTMPKASFKKIGK